jgi:uncharacterized protein YbjT (DUF2867 family)
VLLLVGGTGLLGGRIADTLHEREVTYRALLRDGADASALRGAEIVRGDLQRPETLPPAVEGVDTVITTATSIGRRLGGDKRVSVEGVDVKGNEALVGAAEQSGVAPGAAGLRYRSASHGNRTAVDSRVHRRRRPRRLSGRRIPGARLH